MKPIKVRAYRKALVFKNGKYKRMLGEGLHWLNMGETYYEYDMQTHFVAPVELNILLQHKEIAAALMVLEVKDNELALMFRNGLFKEVLLPGRYAFWKGIIEYSFIVADRSKVAITEPVNETVLAKPELQPFVRTCAVEPNEKGLLYIDGKLESMLEPGVYYFWKNPIPVLLQRIDMRQQHLDMNGQEILTKDKAALRVNFYARYQVTDIKKALCENKEYDKQLYALVQLALREYVATYTLDELLEKRNDIAGSILAQLAGTSEELGVRVTEAGIRDIILPGDMKDIMNQVLVAEKRAQANIITRREETAGTRSMLNTAKLMEENAMLYKLKEMEYVEKIAEKISSISISGGDLAGQLKQILIGSK